MPCYYPLRAWQQACGAVVFAERGDVIRQLELPCGRCIGCRLERSRQWAVRVMHEASQHSENAFITLTYGEDCPVSLQYRDFQLFMKRLRRRHECRFYMCGEYGPCLGRPHFHACIFGFGFPDQVLFGKSDSGADLFVSSELGKLWPGGFHTVQELTFNAAAYVARYCVAKRTGFGSRDHYLDPSTGEILMPEFNRMSLRPGIGQGWFQKFAATDIDGAGMTVVNYRKAKVPRYYDVLMSRVDPERLELIQLARHELAPELSERSESRLRAKEAVAAARLSFKKRILESQHGA